MATLADELLNDFEDTGSETEEQAAEENGTVNDISTAGASATNGATQNELGMELDDDEEDVGDADESHGLSATKAAQEAEDEEETKARIEKLQLRRVADVRSVAGLMKALAPVLEKIEYFQSLPPAEQSKNEGSIEDNPEYRLLTQSNTLSTSIDGEIMLVHKFIRDHYSVRFPELESLITNPLDYAKTVAIIGNGPMNDIRSLSTSIENIVGQPLKAVLDGPSLMVVTVEATTTRGRELSETELQTVLRACEMTLQLDRAKKILTDYVQSRMNVFAPNLTALIGSLTAAQLLNFAGGLIGLAKTPACNIAPLGSKKQSQTGFATNTGVRHQGFLYQSPLIKTIPSDLKTQAMRIVAAKIVLATRIDMVHADTDGSSGAGLRQQCLDRLDRLTEPAPNKGVRALPAPDDRPARKRGGRRARKAKEATAMTDLRRAQNRLAFGKEETEVGFGDRTVGLGMVGQGADEGRVRARQVDGRTRAKLSKKNAGWGLGGGASVGGNTGTASSIRGFGQGAGNASVLRGHGLRATGVGTSTGVGAGISGTMSSVAFTPVQGLELVDPKVREEMNRKRKAEEDRWFKGGTFTQVGSGSATMMPPPAPAGTSTATTTSSSILTAAVDKAGFKVPAVPAKRKAEV